VFLSVRSSLYATWNCWPGSVMVKAATFLLSVNSAVSLIGSEDRYRPSGGESNVVLINFQTSNQLDVDEFVSVLYDVMCVSRPILIGYWTQPKGERAEMTERRTQRQCSPLINPHWRSSQNLLRASCRSLCAAIFKRRWKQGNSTMIQGEFLHVELSSKSSFRWKMKEIKPGTWSRGTSIECQHHVGHIVKAVSFPLNFFHSP